MKRHPIRPWAVLFWLLAWQGAAMALAAAFPHGELLLASPVSALVRLVSLAGTGAFWAAVGRSAAAILGGDAEGCSRRLLEGARLLERGGCTVLAIPCNTSHYFVDRLQAQLHIPIIHMIRETVAAIQAMGKKTVGILATDGTVQTGIYQKELTAAGLTPVTLPERLQKTVMSIIYDEIKKGETGSREKFGEVDAWLRQAGCDCAILGCTELSVYRALHSLPPYYMDAMEVLAEQAILRCGKQLRNV